MNREIARGESLVVAVLDACVLYPASTRDLLMSLAIEGLYSPRWSETIHDEWIENLLDDDRKRNNPPRLTRDKLLRTRELMNKAIPAALIDEGELSLSGALSTLSLSDPGDRHVVAAATASEASVIVTFNLRHFPDALLAPLGIQAVHPDHFLCNLYDTEPELFKDAIASLLARLTAPPRTVTQYIAKLRQVSLPTLAARLESTIPDAD